MQNELLTQVPWGAVGMVDGRQQQTLGFEPQSAAVAQEPLVTMPPSRGTTPEEDVVLLLEDVVLLLLVLLVLLLLLVDEPLLARQAPVEVQLPVIVPVEQGVPAASCSSVQPFGEQT